MWSFAAVCDIIGPDVSSSLEPGYVGPLPCSSRRIKDTVLLHNPNVMDLGVMQTVLRTSLSELAPKPPYMLTIGDYIVGALDLEKG